VPDRDLPARLPLLGRASDAGSTAFGIVVVTGVADIGPYCPVTEVHCLPTLWERIPNVVLEASAMGVPTITLNANAAIGSGGHGGHSATTEQEWEQSLRDLIASSDADRAALLGTRARDVISE
jgi:glycosyltransferase involved in cell wall biosynthesis